MPRSRSKVSLRLYRFRENPHYDALMRDRVLERVRSIDEQARDQGLGSLDSKSDPLIPIGTEMTSRGRVTKNGYGVLHLAWLAEQNPKWAEEITAEAEQIRSDIKRAHGRSLKYVIWAGMGGSAEDKAFYLSAGLINRRVRIFLLDSTDPAKLSEILDNIARREKQPIEQALRRVLVVGMAMGMTSYEPVINLEKLDKLYRKYRIDNRTNFIYLTLPGSILDQFGSQRGFRRIELQPDGGNTTAGRHSAPLTRGSLYPLALNGVDLAEWMRSTFLGETETQAALQLAGFIQSNAEAGRDKLTLHLPSQWRGGAVWTKQDFEESLGKSEKIGIKVIISEKIRVANYYSPRSARQDRCFLFVNANGQRNPDPAKIAGLRRAGYPVAVVDVAAHQPIARYMQFIHYVVFGLGCLRDMNFVTQPGVELYKQHAARIYDQAKQVGGIEKTDAWRAVTKSPNRMRWIGGLKIDFGPLVRLGLLDEEDLSAGNSNVPAVYALALERLYDSGKITYGELTFFGDTRYQASGAKLLSALDDAGDALFRSRLKMAVDVYEGPAMNHSFHEMIIGYGRGFSTVVLTDQQASIPSIGYKSDYHRAQWLATQQALEERGRAVVALTVKDLSDASIETTRQFFKEAARRLRRRLG